MWVLDHVSNWFVLVLFLSGLVGVIIGDMLRNLPIVNKYGFVLNIICTGLVAASLWLNGAKVVEELWTTRMAAAESRAKQAEVESAAVNDMLTKKIIAYDELYKKKQQVIEKIVTNTVTQYDSQCVLPNVTIGVLSAAAEDRLPPSPRSDDGAPSGIKASEVVLNTTDNYVVCNKYRQRLIEWQEWYASQKQIYDKANR